MTLTRAELQDSARRAFGETGFAADAQGSWHRIADMGWLMMCVPDALGGLGLGTEAAGAIHFELGRALVPGPAIAQMLVIEALSVADALAERDALIARAMGGEVMTAPLAADGLTCVPDADKASHVLVLGAERAALVALAGARITHRETWDVTRRLFDVRLDGLAEELVLAEGEAAIALAERNQARLLFSLAADSLGGADAILDLTIDYLKTRHQFGRPLALFQALKHRAADMKTLLSGAEALFWTRAIDPALGAARMGALKAHATATYRQIAEEAIQLHGGIGLTMEHPAHLFLKRAMLNCALGGEADRWDEEAGRRLLAEAR